MKSRQILIALYAKHNGDWLSIFQDLKNKVAYEEDFIVKTAEDFEKKHKQVITLLDNEYPEELKMKLMPPFVLVKD